MKRLLWTGLFALITFSQISCNTLVAPASETVFINERIAIVYPPTSGAPTLTLNGLKVQNAILSSDRAVFDMTLEALGGTYVDQAEAVVRVGGQEVARQRFTLLQDSLSDSNIVAFTQGLDQAKLEDLLDKLNRETGLSEGFSLDTRSFTRVSNSGYGTGVIDIGQQSSDVALKALNAASLDTGSLTVSPNRLYGVAKRGVYWSSPPCQESLALDEFSSESWKLLQKDDVFDLVNVTAAHEAGLDGANILFEVLDTGVDQNDGFDCSDTPFEEGHGTHVYNLAKDIATNAAASFEVACNSEGFCSTEDIVRSLIDIEQESLSTERQKVIANLSFSGINADDISDQAIWQQLKLYETYYPNFIAIAAAGNQGISADPDIARAPSYPAAFSDGVGRSASYGPLGNVIAVGTAGVLTETNELQAASLNPIGVPVDLLAPGVKICLDSGDSGCLPGNDTTGLTGSSFATAIASGIAALAWSECPGLNAKELKALLMANATPVANSPYRLVNALFAKPEGCDEEGVPSPNEPVSPISPDGETLQLSGTVDDWPESYGTILSAAPSLEDGKAGLVFARGEIDLSGRFQITVGAPPAFAPFAPEFNCSEENAIVTEPVGLQTSLLSLHPEGRPYTSIVQVSNDFSFAYLYADTNGSIKGKESCYNKNFPEDEFPLDFDYNLELVRGWNVITYTRNLGPNFSTTYSFESVKPTDLLATYGWDFAYYGPLDPEVEASFTNP